MTDIKLKPDCDLAKAIEEYGLASIAMSKARARLLEVIRKIAFAGMEQVDTFESFTLSDERASEIIKEVMGVIE